MSRYLAPSKISLLALVAIYTHGVVPNSGTIPVLSFLISHVLNNNASEAGDHVTSIQEFETALSSVASSIPGRSIWDLWLKLIWSFDCSDGLDTFLTNIDSVLVKSKEEVERDTVDMDPEQYNRNRISKTSPLGAFVRRAQLEYTRLQIHDAIRLWENFISFRLPTKQAWEKRNPADVHSAIDVNLSTLQIESSSKLARIVYRNLGNEESDDGGLSTFDVERLLEFQVSEMQRLGSRLPDVMRTRLSQISRDKASKPSLLHYLTFLDAWRAGDYSSAFDNLHRYFDYSMQSRDRTFYQYALLNLAILQADFGCHSEAVPAMQEAIATARENKDMNCLNFCMSWLYHFNKAFPEETKEIQNSGMLGSEVEALNFLKSKAKEAEMWSLLSTTLLSEAKLGLQNGESVATALENIAKSAHLNVTKNVTSVVGPTLILRSSVCSRLGLSRLAWSSCETFMECYAADAPMEDKLKCLCRMANMQSQQGHFKDALNLLSNVSDHCGPDVLRVLKYYQYWVFFSGLIKLRRSLHRHDLNTSSHILSQLLSQGAPDIEVSFTLSLLEIEHHIRSADFSLAISKITRHVEFPTAITNDVFAQIKLLNLKALALCKSDNHTKAFSITVRAATMANKARILPCLWESIATLSEILISLDETSAARQLLESIIPAVLETLDHALAARVYSLLADAVMGLARPSPQAHHHQVQQTTPKSTPKSKPGTRTKAKPAEATPSQQPDGSMLNSVLDLLEVSYEKFENMEDYMGMMDCLVKRATVFNVLGDIKGREGASERYLSLEGRWREGLVQ